MVAYVCYNLALLDIILAINALLYYIYVCIILNI